MSADKKSGTDMYSKAIKLLASKLENVKQRIQEKFNETDDRIDTLDRKVLEISEGLRVKLNQDKENSVQLEEFNALRDKLSLMENTINSLQKEITALKSQAVKQKVISVSTPSKTVTPPPPGMKPDVTSNTVAEPKASTIPIGTAKKPEIPSAPKSKTTSIPSAPKLPSTPATTASPKNKIPSTNPSIPSTPSKKRNININDDGNDKDSLLEALKSIDSLVVEGEEEI